MAVNHSKNLEAVRGVEAIKVYFRIIIFGILEFLLALSKSVWQNSGRKSSGPDPPVQIIDSSIGTHYYIKVLGTKYHYVESGPNNGRIVCLLRDSPGGKNNTAFSELANRLSSSEYRVISINLRGIGGSEPGSRTELTPPKALKEIRELLLALGASHDNPVTLVGRGVGGLITWYFVHCNPDIVSRFAVISAPHPNLYWEYPPTQYCEGILHFIQWECAAEHWLARVRRLQSGEDSERWAGWRARDWTSPLHYIRGAAWYKINENARIHAPCLLAGSDGTSLIQSAVFCTSPSLRLISKETNLADILYIFITDGSDIVPVSDPAQSSGLVGRVFSAVVRRGRSWQLPLPSVPSRLLPPIPA